MLILNFIRKRIFIHISFFVSSFVPNVHAVKFSVPYSSCEYMMITSDRLPNTLPVGKRIAGHTSTSNVGHINYSQDIPFSAILKLTYTEGNESRTCP